VRFDVYQLPAQELAVQSFHARGESPYLNAHEELRAAVAQAIGGNGPEEPYGKCSLTIVCYTGKKRQDGRYRAERVHTLHYVLDPIYRALMDSKVITGMEAVCEIRTMLRRDSEREGFRIVVEPL